MKIIIKLSSFQNLFLSKRISGFFILFITFSFVTSSFGQVNITPIRVNVSGFSSTWTDVDVTGTFDIRLLKATSSTASPTLDFDAYNAETLNFQAKKVGTGAAAEYVITVSVSEDNGASWTVLGTRTPTSSIIFQNQTPFDLSSYNGTSIKVKFTVAGTSDTVGVTIDNLKITGLLPLCTWDGTAWSNVVGPDEATEATIDGAYNTGVNGEIITKKLTVTTNGSLVIASGTNVFVVENVINNATVNDFVVENNANLLQINDVPVNVNTGDITVKRETSPLKRLDYVLWSSPVQYQYLQAFSSSTLANRFYTYNPATNAYVVVAAPSTTYFEPTTGYLIRTPNIHPTVPTIWSSTFKGYPNNGDISIPVTAASFNAVGNPYPSVLDADTFITVNNIADPIYFWRKTNGTSSSYATYTLSGGVANTAGGSSLVPTTNIQVGQGFLVKAASTSLNFANSMRVFNNDNLFFKGANSSKSRIWLDLTGNNGLFAQTLIAYMHNATSGIDPAIDGKLFDEPLNGATLTSIINNEDNFVIQGKGDFMNTDIVPLSFKTFVEGNFTITLSNFDGLFADGQNVFLKDNVTNTVHNLTNEPYNFAAPVGTSNTRFEIVYQSSSTLATENPVLNENTVVIYKQNQDIIVNTGSIEMKNVKVYDIQGRLLVEQKDINATTTKLAVGINNQVLIVKVTSKDNEVVTKKVIN